jgi:hypothetical protein
VPPPRSGHDLADAFRAFARATSGVSPLYSRLSAELAERSEVTALLDAARPEQRLPMLLFAAVHHEVLRLGVGYPDHAEGFARFTAEHAGAIRELVASRRTQTNEVGRCAFLLPCLAGLPEPLSLIEVGASAGLNLNLDRYAYRYGERAIGESAVVLAPELRGPPPPVERLPRVIGRVGIDLAPAPDPDWLRACLWPDQPERLARLDAALEIAAHHPPPLVEGDALELLPDLIATTEGTVVVLHSAVTVYFDEAERARLLELVRDVHHVSAEAEDDWRAFVLRVDGRRVGAAQPHGAWLTWGPGQAAP